MTGTMHQSREHPDARQMEERESTHLFLFSAFSGIRIKKKFALSVGRTFSKILKILSLSLGVKDPWLNTT